MLSMGRLQGARVVEILKIGLEKMAAWVVVAVRKMKRKGGIWDMIKIRDNRI